MESQYKNICVEISRLSFIYGCSLMEAWDKHLPAKEKQGMTKEEMWDYVANF